MPPFDPQSAVDQLISQIRSSRKYRLLDIPDATLRDLILRETQGSAPNRESIKAVRHKLHNLVADYLGDPDYLAAARQLDEAFAAGAPAVRQTCASLLERHASTRERLAILDEFYPAIFAVTGQPQIILDLACGLNPLTFPWMGLPSSIRYHAYDLHHPRIDLINHYFSLQGLAPLACHRDILTHPPQESADVAFIFKEAHRMEQRQRGASRDLWQAVNARWLLVSLPPSSLNGRHDKLDQHRRLVEQAMKGLDWPVREVHFKNEVVFCIQKP